MPVLSVSTEMKHHKGNSFIICIQMMSEGTSFQLCGNASPLPTFTANSNGLSVCKPISVSVSANSFHFK